MKILKIFYIILLLLLIVNGFITDITGSQRVNYYIVFPLIIFTSIFMFLIDGKIINSFFVAIKKQWSVFLIILYFILQLMISLTNANGFEDGIKIIIGLIYTLILPFIVYLLAYTYMAHTKYSRPYVLLRKLKIYTVITIIIIIPGFINSILSDHEFSNNIAVFCLIFFIPFVLLERKKWNYLTIAIILIAILITSKRGAIIGLVIPYFIIIFFDSSISIIKKLLLLLLPFCISLLMIFAFPEQSEHVYNRFEKETERNELSNYGSNRGDIWISHYISFNKGTLSQKLFGFGSGSSFDLTEKYSIRRVSAHNAYIAIGYQYGIIGLFLYLIFLIHLLILARIAYKKFFIYSKLVLYTVLAIIITGFTEVHFETYYIIYPFFFLGIMIGLTNNKQYERIIEI